MEPDDDNEPNRSWFYQFLTLKSKAEPFVGQPACKMAASAILEILIDAHPS
jgi:hypothetical protein